MKKNEDFKYITDVNYLLNLLYSLYEKYIGSRKPIDGECRYVLRFYNDGVSIRDKRHKRPIIAFYGPYDYGAKFIFKNYNDMEYFYSKYYNLFNMIEKNGRMHMIY